MAAKRIIIIAGPNGAGKTTFARHYLPGGARCPVFVNADLIAAGLSPFNPTAAAARAGRLMLVEMNSHARAGRSFAFESTLAGRVTVRRIRAWRAAGYCVKLIFLALGSADEAVLRVNVRARQGGHVVAEHVVRRRFAAGLNNFANLYRGEVDCWQMFNNSGATPVLLEEGGITKTNGADMQAAPDALVQAARYAHRVARLCGTGVVIARDGKAVEIPPLPE